MRRATAPKFQAAQRENGRRKFRKCNFRRQAVSRASPNPLPDVACDDVARRGAGRHLESPSSPPRGGSAPYREHAAQANPYHRRTSDTSALSLSLSHRRYERRAIFPRIFLPTGDRSRDFPSLSAQLRAAGPGKGDNARHAINAREEKTG